MSNTNPSDRARLLVEAATDEFLDVPSDARNMKVVEFCNFFLFGEKNQIAMATQQLATFFKSANKKNVKYAADYVASYRFEDLTQSLIAKYGQCPEGWQQQSHVYSEVSRSIYHVLANSNLKIVTFALALLDTLAKKCHRAHNRFLLEALANDQLLRQLRVLWKTHHKKTGQYSMRITEGVLRWVQEWRDELVPSSERKRFDPANKTQWSIQAFQSSINSYSTMSQSQLTAAAKSGAHWFEKRVNEFSGEVNNDKGVFSGLEECHYKLKKRGAEFPAVDFSSSSRGSFDIQRCSSIEEAAIPTFKSERQWDAFASDQSEVAKASESPNSVIQAIEDEDQHEVSPSAFQIKIKPTTATQRPDQQGSFFLAPPPSSPTKLVSAAVAAPSPAPLVVAAAASTETFDFLDFGAPMTADKAPSNGFSGNPFGDDFAAGNPFGDSHAAVADDSDPFAALAMRNN